MATLITHCPSCQTHFRVHAKQLAARAGQVRCGKCSRVFNAIEHLIDETLPASEPVPADEFADQRAATSASQRAEQAPTFEAAEDDAKAPVWMEAAAAGPGVQDSAMAASAEAEPAGQAELMSVPRALPPRASAFDFGPRALSDPDRRMRGWPWLLGAVLLLAILLGQLAYYYRGTVTLLFPETKPYATALCAMLGCEVPLPRRIDLMSIEASDLQADPSNTNLMVLTATIKNRAIFNQQYPFLELTLTDGQDQPLVRRVLTPKDYFGKGLNAQVGVAANSEIGIRVIIEVSQIKATGYRLYLFYP